jgi:hypothetical protein
LQHEIRWLFPDAYVGQPGLDAAVRYNQEWRAAGTERAKARGAEERTAADVSADMGPTWAEAQGRTVEELAAAASSNLAKLAEHAGHGSVADQLKAALKYAARVLSIFEASHLEPGGDKVVRDGLAAFVESRWDIWSADEKGVPKQLILDWVAKLAQDGEVTYGVDEQVVAVDDKARARAIEAVSDWANDTTGRLWRIAASQSATPSAGPEGKAGPGSKPPPPVPKAIQAGGPEPAKVGAPPEPGKTGAPIDAARIADLKAMRLRYLEGIQALETTENEMRRLGRTTEQIARQLVGDRNALKVETRALMKPEEVAQLEARNLKKYGDPVGPTPEWLFDKYGSWDKVLEAVKRTDPVTNQLLGIE